MVIDGGDGGDGDDDDDDDERASRLGSRYLIFTLSLSRVLWFHM